MEKVVSYYINYREPQNSSILALNKLELKIVVLAIKTATKSIFDQLYKIES